MNELVEIESQEDSADELTHEERIQQEQYLSFALGEETFAVQILNVQEIRTWEQPTPLPRSPKHMKGVINLRGTIMPIIDLRIMMKLCEAEYDDTTVVIILRNEVEGRSRAMGVVVDAMTDVVHLPTEEIKAAPEFGGNVDANYVDGLAVVDTGILSILNISALIDISEIDHSPKNKQ